MGVIHSRRKTHNTKHTSWLQWCPELLKRWRIVSQQTQLTTNLCLDVSRGARSSQRCNEGSAWMYSWRQAVAVMLYILQSYCSFTPIKCAERESWEQNGPMMRGRVVSSLSSAFWEDAAAFIVLQKRVRYQMMSYDSNDEIVNKTTKRQDTTDWVNELKTLHHNYCMTTDALYSAPTTEIAY